MPIDQKIALVTGASRGIGKGIALELADQGFFVIGTATSESGVENIQSYLGNRGCARVMNVTDYEAVKNTIQELLSEHERIDVLVNNAGITRDQLLMRMKMEAWQEVLETNLTAQMNLCQLVLRPMLKAQWGRIIQMTSIVAVTGNPGQANYAAAKAGLIGFTKSLALEVASRNITVNCIAPGFIDTEMTQAIPDKQREQLKERIPMQRLGSPQDIAKAVSFLISADYVTGETLHVNGGLLMD